MSPAPGPIRLLLVDDHPVVRDGLRGIFAGDPDFEVSARPAAARRRSRGSSGWAPTWCCWTCACRGWAGSRPSGGYAGRASVRVLVLTTYDTDSDVLPAVEAGATGYLLKDAPREELIRAVRAAFAGQPVLSRAVASRLMGQVRRPPAEALSQRELHVLRLVANGATNREAAARLFVSEATIKTNLLHIYEKLAVRDRAAAVGEAYRRHLLT
jgi:DNA-binding NarL/FixJ family response regulator